MKPSNTSDEHYFILQSIESQLHQLAHTNVRGRASTNSAVQHKRQKLRKQHIAQNENSARREGTPFFDNDKNSNTNENLLDGSSG